MNTNDKLPDTKLIQSPLVVYSKLGNDMVIMNPENGKYHALNNVAATIFEIFSKPHTPADVVESLMQQYDVSKEQCTKESMACINDMLDKKILQQSLPL